MCIPCIRVLVFGFGLMARERPPFRVCTSPRDLQTLGQTQFLTRRWSHFGLALEPFWSLGNAPPHAPPRPPEILHPRGLLSHSEDYEGFGTPGTDKMVYGYGGGGRLPHENARGAYLKPR
jgi:hypothetical protein